MRIARATVLSAGVAFVAAAAAGDAPPVVTEAVIAAPAAKVWSAYTSGAELEKWAVGKSSEVELAIGAEWRTSYDKSSTLDDDTVIRNEVLAFDPERMLAVRTVEPPAGFPFPNAILDAWTVMYLDPVDAASTRVTVKMFGFSDADESQRMRAFFERGNAFELRKLAEYVGGRVPAAR
jgi:uncharacterized protein YndB with AHSA1/START domain